LVDCSFSISCRKNVFTKIYYLSHRLHFSWCIDYHFCLFIFLEFSSHISRAKYIEDDDLQIFCFFR
jgi:hypothetical protein